MRFSERRSQTNAPVVHTPLPGITNEPLIQSTFKASASKAVIGKPPSNVLDGELNTDWRSGADPVQWIQIDLGSRRDVLIIRLFVGQFPSGDTVHEIWGGTRTNNLELLHRLTGFTSDHDVLVFDPTDRVRDIRFIRVITTKSPSWVAWREIEVLRP